MKKLLLLFLVVFVVFGCGVVGAVDEPLFEEDVTISMLYPDHSGYPYQKDWPALVRMKELTNVTLDPTLVADSDFENKRRIVISSGEIQDIIITKGAQMPEFALNGVFLPINKYMDKLPNLQKRLIEWNLREEFEKSLTELDGNIYYLPAFNFIQPVGYAIRVDLLEKHNLPVPETYDELYQVLKKLKEYYPDSNPWTNQFGWGNTTSALGDAFGTRMGWSLGNGFDYNREEDRWVHGPTSEEYKELLSYLHKMFEEGIIHEDAFVQDHDQFTSKITTGKSFFTVTWVEQLSEWNKNGKEIVGEEFELAMIQPPEGPNGAYVPGIAPVSTAAVIPAALENDPEHLDKVLKFIDWMYYSEEGLDLFTYGVEGLSYNIVEGKKVYTDEVITDDNPDGSMALSSDVGSFNNAFTPNRPFEWRLSLMDKKNANYFSELRDNNGLPLVDPPLKMDSLEQEEIGLMSKTLVDYTEEMSQKFVYGNLSVEEDWDDFVKGAEQRNLKSLLERINKIWERQQNMK